MRGIMLVLAVMAAVLLTGLAYVAERVRRNVVVRHRRRVADERLRAVMRETEKRLELEQRKRDQAAALTSVVPAIREHDTRHVA